MFSPTAAVLKLIAAFSLRPIRSYTREGLSSQDIAEIETTVRPALAELEALRHETLRRIDWRAVAFVPIGGVAGFVCWKLFDDTHTDLLGVFSVVLWAWTGCVGAWHKPDKQYRAAYKSRVLPHLTRRFGALDYRPAQEPDLARLAKYGFIPQFGVKKIEDEIFGAYRGVGVNIVEANLETGGKHSTVVFNGLVVALDVTGRFTGTTLVTKDTGALGNSMMQLFGRTGLERVRLEDPRFEERYQVYSTDQVEARAFLTPAIMERVMELESHARDDPPRLLAEPNRLWVSIPKHKKENLFEPPSLSEPAEGSAGALLDELSRDIGSVVHFIDAVLALDPLNAPAEAVR